MRIVYIISTIVLWICIAMNISQSDPDKTDGKGL